FEVCHVAMKHASLLVLIVAATLGAGGAELSLVDAVKAGNPDAVVALLKKSGGRDVNTREPDGTTALHWAIRGDEDEIVRLLLKAGASPDAANRYGVTPLMLAATNGNPVLTDLLLKAGADANAALPRGETVLMTAARAGNPDVVKLLLDRGANINAADEQLGE